MLKLLIKRRKVWAICF